MVRLFGVELRVWRWLQELNEANSTEEDGEMGYGGADRAQARCTWSPLGVWAARLDWFECLAMGLQVEVKPRGIGA